MRASTGNTYHWAANVLTLRIVQPPADLTGDPTWRVRDEPTPSFWRDGTRIPRYEWNPRLHVAVDCPVAINTTLCMGAAVMAEPQPCAAGWVQTAYDQCCDESSGMCVDPDGRQVTRI